MCDFVIVVLIMYYVYGLWVFSFGYFWLCLLIFWCFGYSVDDGVPCVCVLNFVGCFDLFTVYFSVLFQ